jgi:hypothetical protein
LGERHLLAAIAFQTVEDVGGQTLRIIGVHLSQPGRRVQASRALTLTRLHDLLPPEGFLRKQKAGAACWRERT